MSFPKFSTQFRNDLIPYTGHELRPHFLLEKFKIQGSAICAFAGPCQVATSELVDWEDRLAHDRIEARMMLHFIGEFFGLSLREGVLLQRLLIAIMNEEIALSRPKEPIHRDGDDLFAASERKLSVSIATVSPVSVLLHVGVNMDPTGAPVPTIGLEELGIDPLAWAERVLKKLSLEWESMDWACVKVRPVI